MSRTSLLGLRLLLLAGLAVAPTALAQRFTELRSGSVLWTNGVLSDPLNGRWQLRMQGDCNLVLYRDNSAQWKTDTAGRGVSCYLAMGGDGNLVVYNGYSAVWASNTGGNSGARLRLYADGGLYIARQVDDWRIWWAQPVPGNWGQNPWTHNTTGQLGANQTLWNGDVLSSPSGKYNLDMQSDCNLVLYTLTVWSGREYWWRWTELVGSVYPTQPIGATSTSWYSAECRAVMQGDGNFVVYDYANRVIAKSDTYSPGAFLRLQDDGNLVIYDRVGRPIWATGTVNHSG